MVGAIDLDHPKQKLLFYVAQDVDEDIPEKMKRYVTEIARGHEWLLGGPTFVDEMQQSEIGTPFRTVGGVLELYSALPPSELPVEIDRRHLDETTYLVDALRTLSANERLAIEFYLDDTFVGSVEDGKIDRALAEGLLGDWCRTLDKKAQRH